MNSGIAIQGFEGSFHQEAVRRYFGRKTAVVCCASFPELIQKAENPKESAGGLMAIENSIAGSILPNYNLLQKSALIITGEIYLQIQQQLLVNPGVRLQDIREVHSHPMAIQQCMTFLKNHPWKLVETEDTALSAAHIHQRRSKHIAAIAGKTAAEIYQLEIAAPNIHTLKNNYTRFLVLKRQNDVWDIPEATKASVQFHTDHTRGSLARVLTTVAAAGINLSKLQSMPIAGTRFKYSFHADMEFDHTDQLKKVLKKIQQQTEALRILGIYKNGNLKK